MNNEPMSIKMDSAHLIERLKLMRPKDGFSIVKLTGDSFAVTRLDNPGDIALENGTINLEDLGERIH